jgi:hypothetical protein
LPVSMLGMDYLSYSFFGQEESPRGGSLGFVGFV